MKVTARSRLLAVLGDPVEHSLSPVMQNAAIAALGMDAVYVALRVPATAAPSVFAALAEGAVAGNVTLPHKAAMAAAVSRATPLAEALGAVNTFWPEDGRLVGDNTDVAGVLEATDALEAEGAWLLAGTGGAARAVAAAARERRTVLLVRSRSSERAAAFLEWAAGIGARAEADDGRAVALAVNATPLGLASEDPHPFPDDRIDSKGAVLDLVYAPGGTGWVRQCRDRGLTAHDGRHVLVAQGAHAFERFFPGSKAPRQVMLAAVERALAER